MPPAETGKEAGPLAIHNLHCSLHSPPHRLVSDMDFFKGFFGINSSPPPAKASSSQAVQKAGPNNCGPLTHPAFPNLVFACVLVPPSLPEEFPIFVFYLWDRGLASFYRYQSKKQGDKTPATLMNAFSNPSNWNPSDHSVCTSLHPIFHRFLLIRPWTDPFHMTFPLSKCP